VFYVLIIVIAIIVIAIVSQRSNSAEVKMDSMNNEKSTTSQIQSETENKENLLEYQEEKPGVINADNVSDVIAALRRRKEKQE
jgi:CBS domain-containing protein